MHGYTSKVRKNSQIHGHSPDPSFEKDYDPYFPLGPGLRPSKIRSRYSPSPSPMLPANHQGKRIQTKHVVSRARARGVFAFLATLVRSSRKWVFIRFTNHYYFPTHHLFFHLITIQTRVVSWSLGFSSTHDSTWDSTRVKYQGGDERQIQKEE
ncbi:hypothetical protein IE53DRAFT_34565 [Violaceomyces palustris]|uniref:Uncharacterized protein n=1 Tax=Violaceomyces palustris TaxID=1673888 RepID=A0ACD0P154_9BASI|nr:hypothetical protein IE53DRAFT_34565 [Violaceomyces palustris]